VPVTAATGAGEQGASRSADHAADAAGSEAPQKMTRYEAMWTEVHCDPELREYVIV
jgi:hypothetical protein